MFERPYIGVLPLEFFLFYAALASALLEVVLGDGLRRKWPELITITPVIALMAVMGVLRDADPRWWIIDASNVSGLLLGMYWGSQRPIAAALKFLTRLALICTLLLIVTIIGLMMGFVEPAIEGERTFTYGLFSSAVLISLTLPMLCAITPFGNSPSGRPRWVLVACLGSGSVLVAAILSATRTILILGVVSLALTSWVMAKSSKVFVVSMAVLVVVACGGLLALQVFLSGSSLAGRLERENEIREESRYIEVEMMFADLSTPASWWLGKGFGSRFPTVVVVDGEDRAIAPHIGITTFWYKGGLLGFLAIAVYPALRGLYRLFARRGAALQLACSAGLITYVVMSSLTGGWSFGVLFMYGAFIALSGRQSKEFER